MELDVLICTLEQRRAQFERLYAHLRKLAHLANISVNILYYRDAGQVSVGEKRNWLLFCAAKSPYVCFIDDDDWVTDKYMEVARRGMEQGVDVIELRGIYIADGGITKEFVHSRRYSKYTTTESLLERPPNHLNIMKRSIATLARFPEKSRGEDFDWAMQLLEKQPYTTELSVSEPYYEYHFTSMKPQIDRFHVPKRTIALLVPSTSRTSNKSKPSNNGDETIVRNVRDLPLLKVLLPSVRGTVSSAYRCVLYLGIDADDPLYSSKRKLAEVTHTAKELGVNTIVTVFPSMWRGHLTRMWNQLYLRALMDGCDYFYQIGDDSLLLTRGWDSQFVGALERTHGYGVAAPNDINHVADIYTQSFVSRKHFEIFGYLFPEQVRNWFCDNWMTSVYPRHLSHYFSNIRLDNTSRLACRYVPDNSDKSIYQLAVIEGQALIRNSAAPPDPLLSTSKNISKSRAKPPPPPPSHAPRKPPKLQQKQLYIEKNNYPVHTKRSAPKPKLPPKHNNNNNNGAAPPKQCVMCLIDHHCAQCGHAIPARFCAWCGRSLTPNPHSLKTLAPQPLNPEHQPKPLNRVSVSL